MWTSCSQVSLPQCSTLLPSSPRATGPTLGAPAPDFALVDQSGKTVRLSDLRGAPVLLVFYRGHW